MARETNAAELSTWMYELDHNSYSIKPREFKGYLRLVINQAISWDELAAKALELNIKFDWSFSKFRLAALIDNKLGN